MIPILLCGLMLTSALANPLPEKNFDSARPAAVVRRGRQGRQLLTGFRNGQALTNGAVVRRVLRRGRGNIATTAPLPLAAAPVINHVHPAVATPFIGPAPAPLLLRNPVVQPAPAPVVVRTPVAHHAPVVAVHHQAPLHNIFQHNAHFAASPALAPAFVPPPQLVAQIATPQIVAAPAVEEPAVIAVRNETPEPAVVAPTLEYGAPSTVAPEVRAPVEGYGAPLEVVEVTQDYLPAAEEEPEETQEIVEVRQGYLAAEPAEVVAVRAEPTYIVPRTVANVKSDTVKAKPIAIVRSQYNPPAATSVFDYSFESENGIKQEAVGTMKVVDDNEVSVMKGSYSYIGADGESYQVDWYADETGFHASAPHLPKPVVPNHAEVAAAVKAQIAFAAEEDAADAASGKLAGYGTPAERLAGYTY